MADDKNYEDVQNENMSMDDDISSAEYEEVPVQGSGKYKSLLGWGIFGLIFIGFGLYQLVSLFKKPDQTNNTPVIKKEVLTKSVTTITPANAKSSAPIVMQGMIAQPMLPSSTPSVTSTNTSSVIASTSPATMPITDVPSAVSPSVMIEKVKTTTATLPDNKQLTSVDSSKITKTISSTTPPISISKTITTTSSTPVEVTNRLISVENGLTQHNRSIEVEKSLSRQQWNDIHQELDHMNRDLQDIKNLIKDQNTKSSSSVSTPTAVKAKKIRSSRIKTISKHKKRMILKDTSIRHDMSSGKMMTPRETYYVRAVVPGRAWLQCSSGQTISVNLGDNIEGYGKVVRIDAEHGMVVMSNGQIFPFGINAE